MDQLVQHGVNVVGVEWTGEGTYEEGAFLGAVLPAISSRPLQFVLVYDLAIRFPRGINMDDTDVRQDLIADFSRFAADTRFFKHPKYLKFENQPVVYIYLSRQITGSSGNIQSAFGQVHAAAAANGFSGLYIVADHLWWPSEGYPDYNTLSHMGASAVSAFGPVDGRAMPARPIRSWATALAGLYQGSLTTLPPFGLLDVNPGIFVQYDETGESQEVDCDEARPGQRYHLVDATDWDAMIRTGGLGQRWVARETETTRDCEAIVSTNAGQNSIVWIYSFNEWGEGTGMEPLESRSPAYPFGFGFGPLQTLGTALGAGGGSSDPPPAPTPRNPEGTVEGQRPRFQWDGVQYGDQYHLKVLLSDGTEVINTQTGATGLTAVANLAAGEVHRWKVKAHTASGGWGAFSEAREFIPREVFTQVPSVPAGVAPAGCAEGVQPRFTWAAADRATYYRLVITEHSPEQHVVGLTTQAASVISPVTLEADRLHRWKVKAGNSVGESAYSATLYFMPVCGPSISISDVTVSEGAGSAAFVVSLSAASSEAVAVSYATSNGTAQAGSDYGAVSGTLTFAPGVTSQTVAVPVTSDTGDEMDETFTVGLSTPVGASIVDPQGTGTILDDDPPAISIADCTVVERHAGTSPCAFALTLSSASSVPVTLNFITTPGTAIADGDYVWTWSGVTFPPGTTLRGASVSVFGDSQPEGNETFFITLSNPANATIGRGQALGTILDDEATRFYPLTACRVLDTRLAVGSGGPIVSAGERRSFAVAGSCGIPSTAKAVAMNVTTVQQSAAGSLRLFPAGLATPPTSTINFAAGHPRSNNGTLLLGTGGKATAQCDMPAGGQTQIIVDVFGYYQ